MLGIGFLFTSALGGIALIGWPLYLHLRNRNKRRIQTVPSLRLFGFAKKKTKRIRLEQLFLLLARIFFIVALCALLAQPFWETTLDLPLPPVAGDSEPERYVAIVLDESVSSIHADEAGSRLDVSRNRLKQMIEKLPTGTRVVFVPVTCPYPTARLTREEALAFLERVNPIPKSGNAWEAMINVRKVLAGELASVVIAAPRNAMLWDNMANDDESGMHAQYLDVTEIQSDAFLRSFADNALSLGGNPEVLKGMSLELRGQDGTATIQKISTHDALRGEVDLDVDADKNEYYELRLAQENKNPWNVMYVRPGMKRQGRTQVLIMREKKGESLFVDQLLTAVILSFRPDANIAHMAPQGGQVLERTQVLVVVGNPRISPKLRRWFDEQVDAGVRIVCAPVLEQASGKNAVGILPRWQRREFLGPNEMPLRVINETVLPLDTLTLIGLQDLPSQYVVEPWLGDEQQVILATQQNRTLLASIRVGERSSIWAFGLPFVSDAEGPLWHPAFPMLLHQVLFPSSSSAEADLDVFVGDTVRINSWFRENEIDAELRLPNNSTIPVRSSLANPMSLAIDDPGIYELILDRKSRYRVANYPREERSAFLSREQWEENWGGKVSWHDEGIELKNSDFHRLGSDEESIPRQKLDLSPLAFGTLLVFMIVESFFLYLVWRREGVVRV